MHYFLHSVLALLTIMLSLHLNNNAVAEELAPASPPPEAPSAAPADSPATAPASQPAETTDAKPRFWSDGGMTPEEAFVSLRQSIRARTIFSDNPEATARQMIDDLEKFANLYPGSEETGIVLITRGKLAAQLGEYEIAESSLTRALPLSRDPRQAMSTRMLLSRIKVRPGGTPPAFEITTIDGKRLTLASFKGKAVVLDFWATWCGPCIDELPNVRATYEQWRDKGLELVSISLDDDVEVVRQFIAGNPMPWHHVHNQGGRPGEDMASMYGAFTIPHMILIGPDGKVADVGMRGAGLDAAIRKVLAPETPTPPATQPAKTSAAPADQPAP